MTATVHDEAALPALIRNLALHLASVRLNLIAAGFVDTPLPAAILGDHLHARREQLRTTLPIRRVVGPADVASLAVHLITNPADEPVIDSDIRHGTGKGAHRGTDGHPQQRDEEEQPEQQAPEAPTQRACPRQAAQLLRLGLPAPLRPGHDGSVNNLKQLLLLQPLQRIERTPRAIRGVELPHRQRRHIHTSDCSGRDV